MAVDSVFVRCLHGWLRLPLLVILLLLQDQNVRLIPDNVLLWLHGSLQYWSRDHVRHIWVCRGKCFRQEDLFYGKNRLMRRKPIRNVALGPMAVFKTIPNNNLCIYRYKKVSCVCWNASSKEILSLRSQISFKTAHDMNCSTWTSARLPWSCSNLPWADILGTGWLCGLRLKRVHSWVWVVKTTEKHWKPVISQQNGEISPSVSYMKKQRNSSILPGKWDWQYFFVLLVHFKIDL